MQKFRLQNQALWVLALLVVLAALGTRYEMIGAIGLSHDETISVITAQGNSAPYGEARRTLTNRWVPATKWKAFFAEPSDRSLIAIGRNLAEHDIHPPLYFWTLRAWIGTFGSDAARAMNLPIMMLGAAALFAFARRCLSPTAGSSRPTSSEARRVTTSAPAAMLAVAIWLLSPETIRISATARQYELLGLFAILMAWQTARLLDGNTNRWNLAAFGVIALCAMLTQYLAAIVILTAVGYVALERRDLLLRIGIVLTVAGLLFCLIHPSFYMQFGSYETAANFSDRLIEATSTLLGFYGWRKSWTSTPVAWALCAALITLIAITALYWPRLSRYRLPIAFAVLPASVTLAAYLASLTPSHAFSGRHISFAWPFIALLHAIAIDCISRRAGATFLVLLAVAVGPAEIWVARGKPQHRPDPIIATAPQIVVNNTATGILPRYLRSASANAAVYASDDLTVDLSWLGDLKAGAIVIVNPQYLPPATFAKTERLLEGRLTPVSREWTTTTYRKP